MELGRRDPTHTKFWVEYDYVDGLGNGIRKGDPTPALRHGQLVVSVANVPDDRFDGGLPKTDVIWQAEEGFMNLVRNDLPAAAVVVRWCLFLHSKDGPLVSEYRLHY